MHKVTFTLPERELGKADIEVKVRHNKVMLGTLKVSKGSLVWVPRDEQKGHKINWVNFDKYMQTQDKVR